jgi:hypothetical protein
MNIITSENWWVVLIVIPTVSAIITVLVKTALNKFKRAINHEIHIKTSIKDIMLFLLKYFFPASVILWIMLEPRVGINKFSILTMITAFGTFVSFMLFDLIRAFFNGYMSSTMGILKCIEKLYETVYGGKDIPGENEKK